MSGSKPKHHDKAPGLGESSSSSGVRISGRLWLEKDGDTFLAWGRVVLLERIREHGSLNAAAKSMGMGYRHAWDLVDEMNRLSPKQLVTKSTGGRGGGGSELTAEGEAAVASFWKLIGEFKKWLKAQDPNFWLKTSSRKGK